ncbi:uncharacterized protein LOC116264383 [Nymphaea colorata]|nr:uncharacterized protein LOC116264383 [Nymphaea colorata]
MMLRSWAMIRLAPTTTTATNLCVRFGASSPRKPRVPLFLRPLVYTTTIPDLQKWRSWARNLALSVGSKFVELDNGPDSHTLCREVEWLLEDAVEGYDARLRQTTATDSGGTCLRMRAGLGELYCLWKERVEQRRPFQYVVGCEHWGDIVLSVEEGVLIPRPETVQVVELVDQLCSADQRFREGLWADLGTGSGAIAIGIGRILKGRGRVVAVDLSDVAVAVASYNVERHGLQDIVDVRHGSWFDPLEDVQGKLDGLVSNPPYIPSDQISGLQAEVGRHEPLSALDGGQNGMDDLLCICRGSVTALRPGGFVAFETNGGEQADFVANFLGRNNFCNVKVVTDFAGIPRFVTGFRS